MDRLEESMVDLPAATKLPPEALPPIPSFEEQELEVKRLWRRCITLAVTIFLVEGALVAWMFLAGMEPGRASAITAITFQVILLAYGMGFFVPAFLTSLKRLRLSIHMMYESLRMGRETVEAMESVKDEAKPLFADARKLVDKASPETLDRLEGYLRDVRDRVVRDTDPLPVNKRGGGNGEAG